MSRNKSKRIAALLLALLALTALLSACKTSSDIATPSAAPSAAAANPSSEPPAAPPPADKSVVISLAAAWDNLNVFDYGSDYAAYVESQIFDKLAVLNRSGEVLPRLLSSWEISSDGLVVTGKVDADAKWQDGEPVTADDIVFTYSLFTSGAVVTSARSLIIAGTDASGILPEGGTLGVRAIDEKTVEFTVKERTQEILFFSDADKFFILPKHLLESADPATILDNRFFSNPVGSGPFKFVSQIIGTEAVLTANPDYFKGAPKFSSLTIRVITNNNVLSGLLSGDVDLTAGTGISALPHSDYLIAERDASLVTKSLPHLGSQILIVNTTSPAISDVRVRQAFELAYNKQSIVDNLYGGEATTLYSPIIPSNSYYNKDLIKNTYDPEKAKSLLDEAGFDYSAVIRTFVPAGVTEREQAAVLFQQDLAAIGVKVDVQVVEFAAIGEALAGENGFEFCFMGYTPTVAPNGFASWFIPSPSSTMHWTDSSIIDAYRSAETAATDAEARVFYNQAQQLIEDQLPLIFLYSPNNLIAHNARIGNINYDNYFLTDNIYEWTVE